MRSVSMILLGTLALFNLQLQAQDFRRITEYRGLGALVATAVGPSSEAQSERVYLSYLYVEHTIDVVAVDPHTGHSQVFPNPARGESGARCMVIGPDGNAYLGTLPTAHFLKLDTKQGKLIDLGRPSPTEQYIWDVAFGADGKLYGATYPQAKLVRYDPSSGKLEDLGRMDPAEQYAHYVAGSDDGFMYVGIGTSKANIAAYEIATGAHKEILPSQFQQVGQATVFRGRDGKVYGKLGAQYFALQGWTATPLESGRAPEPAQANRLKDGSVVSVSGRALTLTKPGDAEPRKVKFDYAGNVLDLFRVAFGPDHRLYGSSILPIHLLRLASTHDHFEEIGDLGGGEIYSFLPHQEKLLAAAYSGIAPLMKFDPSQPVDLTSPSTNPALVNFANSDRGWRPQAMIEGPNHEVVLGAVAGYGKLGGPLVTWDTATDQVRQYPQLIHDQSVVSLAAWKSLIVGGTTIGGGGGSHPTQKEAKLFLWDPKTHAKTFEAIPVAGAARISDLITAPNGLVYGIAGGVASSFNEPKQRTPQSILFVFSPETSTIVARKPAPFQNVIYNAVAVIDGQLWGLASDGIFRIDTRSNDVSLVAKSPVPVTGGFAITKEGIYFTSGAELWQYRFPPKPQPHP